ncbi:hypothetical protein BH23PLA1_BH23PLA1_32650 [soil metagenome]
MSDVPPPRPSWSRRAALPAILVLGLLLRVLASGALQLYAIQKQVLDVFGDTRIYWYLAGTIRAGSAYVVAQWEVPHYSLRTPGYPLFLAACQTLFGPENTLAPRLIQAVLGAACAWLAYRLVARVLQVPADRRTGWTVPTIAAVLVAIEPFTVGMSALLLSEGLFVPWMLLALGGHAALWTTPASQAPRAWAGIALGTGLAHGSAILVRPSWALFVPLLLLAWIVLQRRGRTLRAAAIVTLGVVLMMAPWWMRNAQVHGRFVPTALWVGASLYDGLSPEATGASDMDFLDDPTVRVLSEVEKDREWTRRSLAFARENPLRVLELAAIKAARFWSPWPNAEELDLPGLSIVSALATLPIFALLLVGLWDRRRDLRALILLAGPLLYFLLLHMVFVSSIRYRLPGMVPALGLAAVGLVRLVGRDRRTWEPGEVRKVAAWVLSVPIAVAIGGGWYAYTYATDSTTLAALIRQQAPAFLPGSLVEVRRVTVRPMAGEVTLELVDLRQELDGESFPTLQVAWLRVRHDIWELLRGKAEPKQIILAQPTLRLARRQDGTWNLQGLIADPWPAPPLEDPPTVLIRNGTVLLDVEGQETPAAILRDVMLELVPIHADQMRFEGSARGDGFERLKLVGTVNINSGRLEIRSGELTHLELTEVLGRCLPAEWRPTFQRIGMTAGQVDLTLRHLNFDPAHERPLQYDAEVRLHQGTWSGPDLPFPINDLMALIEVRDGTLTIDRASGTNGRTTVHAKGTLSAEDPENGPLDLYLDVEHLEVDNRLRAKTPPDLAPFWDEFQPSGEVNVYLRAVRDQPGGPVGMGLTVDCLDVSILFHEFLYPFEHLRGRLFWENDQILIDRLTAPIGGKLASCWGTIEEPGPEARVNLHFEAEILPIDRTLIEALPEDVQEVVNQFSPSGVVQVTKAHLQRHAPTPAFPEGEVLVTATLELLDRCAFTWVELPYPVTDVTGRLVLAPNRWDFHEIRGWNGLAEIEGNGWVQAVGPDLFDADLHCRARHLPFNEQLKRALPPEWQATWETLNPTGSTSLDARITLEQNVEHYRIKIEPEEQTSIRLEFVPVPAPGAEPVASAPAIMKLPAMEQVSGTFFYDDGLVHMTDVGFQFRGAPVSFRSGLVRLEDSGRFDLGVVGLWVTNFRIDNDLRRLMPPVMAEFARQLDESPALPLMSGDLQIGWSGLPGEPAFVSWENGLIVFNGQNLRTDMPLRYIQGKLDGFQGRFDGQTVAIQGRLDLDSVNLMGQQLTRLVSPIEVSSDMARLDDIRGELLGGILTGRMGVSLDATPRYSANLAVEGAELAQFARTLPGRQTFAGQLSGQIAFNGMGSDRRTLQGEGEFRIRQGDLGELPVALRLFKFLNTAPPTKTAFDSATVSIQIRDGLASLNPIQLTGDAISLRGGGTLDLQGDLDIRLRLLYGRDRYHIPLLSDAMREASGQIVDVRVIGPLSFPRFQLEALPQASELFKSFSSRALGGG